MSHKGVWSGEGGEGLKSAEKVSRIIWMAPNGIFQINFGLTEMFYFY